MSKTNKAVLIPPALNRPSEHFPPAWQVLSETFAWLGLEVTEAMLTEAKAHALETRASSVDFVLLGRVLPPIAECKGMSQKLGGEPAKLFGVFAVCLSSR